VAAHVLEGDVKKCITDFLDAERIPWWRMNAGDRYGSYTSKRTGKSKRWKIAGQLTGTADLLCSPKIRQFHPCGAIALRGYTDRELAVAAFLWIEVKRPGEKQTADQIRFQQECLNRGHAYLLADSVDAVMEWLKERR
jgi:hypothetical protein